MAFVLQVSNPATQPPRPAKVADLAQAVEAIYPMMTEDAVFIWNFYPLLVGYKYDLSVMIDDLLPMLSQILDLESGEYVVHWGSDTFRDIWRLRWDNDQLTAEIDWQGDLGDRAEFFQGLAVVNMARADFLAEWKMLLTRIRTDVESAPLKMANRAAFDRLRAIEAAIPRYGQLYSTVSGE